MTVPASALDRGVVVAADRPVVQVSWHDAKPMRRGCRKRPASITGCRPTRNGRSPPAANSGMTACRSTRTIRRSAGSPAMSANPIARRPTRRRAFGSFRRSTRTACRSRRQCLGMDQHLLRPQRARRGRRVRLEATPIAASASSKASTAPTSPTSSATPAPAACRRAIAGSGWARLIVRAAQRARRTAPYGRAAAVTWRSPAVS